MIQVEHAPRWKSTRLDALEFSLHKFCMLVAGRVLQKFHEVFFGLGEVLKLFIGDTNAQEAVAIRRRELQTQLERCQGAFVISAIVRIGSGILIPNSFCRRPRFLSRLCCLSFWLARSGFGRWLGSGPRRSACGSLWSRTCFLRFRISLRRTLARGFKLS